MAVEGRVVKQRVSWSADLAEVSCEAALLFTWGLVHADRRGRIPGDPRVVKAKVVPMRSDFTPEVVERCLCELAEARLVKWYEVRGEKVVLFPTFEKHQSRSQLARERESDLPAPDGGKMLPENDGPRGGIPTTSAEATKVIPMFGQDGGGDEAPTAWNGQTVLALWLDLRETKGLPRPGGRDMGKYGAAAKRIAEQYSPAEVVAAMLGIEALFPHSKGEPWDMMDLERKFTKAVAAAANHPKVREARFLREFAG